MVRWVFILMLFLPLCAQADSDTLLTCEEYGFRVLNLLNVKDTINGNDRYDSGYIQICIRMAFNDVSKKVTIPKAKAIATSSGTRGYLVEAGLIKIERAERTDDKSTRLMYPLVESSGSDPNFKSKMQAGDSVRYYDRHGDSIMFYPIPNHVDTVILQYYARPDHPDASSDTVYIPYEYRDALIIGAAYYAKLGRDDKNAVMLKTEYDTQMAGIVSQMIQDERVIPKQ